MAKRKTGSGGWKPIRRPRMTRAQRKIVGQALGLGATRAWMEPGTRHMKMVVEAPDGRMAKMPVSRTMGGNRAAENTLSQIRRFIHGDL